MCFLSVFSYADFTSMFHAELYNPDDWATLFKNSGAKCEYNNTIAQCHEVYMSQWSERL